MHSSTQSVWRAQVYGYIWGTGKTWVPESVEDSERQLWEAMAGLERGRDDYTCRECGVKE